MSWWAATCVDQRSWMNITVTLIPWLEEIAKCDRLGDQTLRDRCAN